MRTVKGFALLEMLVTIFIMQIAWLAITKTQVQAWHALQKIRYYRIACQQIQNLSAVLRAKPGMQITAWWQQHLPQLLPDATYSVHKSKFAMLIHLTWNVLDSKQTLVLLVPY